MLILFIFRRSWTSFVTNWWLACTARTHPSLFRLIHVKAVCLSKIMGDISTDVTHRLVRIFNLSRNHLCLLVFHIAQALVRALHTSRLLEHLLHFSLYCAYSDASFFYRLLRLDFFFCPFLHLLLCAETFVVLFSRFLLLHLCPWASVTCVCFLISRHSVSGKQRTVNSL